MDPLDPLARQGSERAAELKVLEEQMRLDAALVSLGIAAEAAHGAIAAAAAQTMTAARAASNIDRLYQRMAGKPPRAGRRMYPAHRDEGTR